MATISCVLNSLDYSNVTPIYI